MTKKDKPRCVWCGRPLRKYFRYRCTSPDGSIFYGPNPAEGWDNAEVVHVKESNGFRTETLWRGEWGRYADGHFCGRSCGYAYAVEIRRIADETD